MLLEFGGQMLADWKREIFPQEVSASRNFAAVCSWASTAGSGGNLTKLAGSKHAKASGMILRGIVFLVEDCKHEAVRNKWRHHNLSDIIMRATYRASLFSPTFVSVLA